VNWAAWRHLPRDTRDTLFHLAVITWTVLPHAANLPWWCVALAAAMLAWRTQLALTNGPLPSRWVVGLVLGLAVGLTLWTERTLLGKEAGVTMLVVLMTLKTLELRARRDAMVTFFLGFFLVLTHFLYSQSLLVAASMVVSVWGLLTGLVLAHMPVGRPSLRQAGATAARAAALGAPIMVALFLLFPRMGPLWGMPQDAAGRTGLSGSLRLGGIAELANDDSVALRVRFFGPAPSPGQMYFRGPVLSSFNGREWSRRATLTDPAGLRDKSRLEVSGAPLRYEMTVEPSRLAMLPVLEVSSLRPGLSDDLEGLAIVQREDLEWVTDRPVSERLRFEAEAWTSFRLGPFNAMPSLASDLRLPEGHSPRTREWALGLRQRPELQAADTPALVQAVLQHIRTAGFTYTLEPGAYGADAIDEFWLDRKLGFCEHFAASFVFVMRTLGVPARIVTGYQGTDPAPVDGYWIVRQSHAHAWAEYWVSGTGWVRADPTAAVAPERVQRSASLAPPRGAVAGALLNVNPEIAARMRQAWEVMNNRWNQYVLNYSRGQQFELLRSVGVSSPSWQDLAYVMAVLLSLAASVGAGWALWDRWRQDPWLRLQQRVAEQLAALGVAVEPHHAPRARAQRVRATLGERGETLAGLLDALDRARYGATGPTGRAGPVGWWDGFAAAVAATRKVSSA